MIYRIVRSFWLSPIRKVYHFGIHRFGPLAKIDARMSRHLQPGFRAAAVNRKGKRLGALLADFVFPLRLLAHVLRFAIFKPDSLQRRIGNILKSCLPGFTGADHFFTLLDTNEKQGIADDLMTLPQNLLVSVIMPTWNRADTIQAAIRSILAQRYTHWELHVVDDGSEDHTAEIVDDFRRYERRIKYHRNDHQGVSVARNIGLAASRGDIIAYLDSDNEWNPDYLLLMVNKIAAGHPCAYCALKIIDHHRSAVSYRNRLFDLPALKEHNYIDLNVFAHRRDLYTEMGGFDPTLKRWVDWDLILRYVTRHTPGLVPAALCSYHIRPNVHRISEVEAEFYHPSVLNKHLVPWVDLEQRNNGRRKNHASIIIPVYNRALVTENCIHSIIEQTEGVDFDVIIVDNRSNYVTKAMIWNLAQKYNQLTHLENQGNYSFALACNVGFGASTGEYVVFLNNDTVVTRNWLKQLIMPLADDPSVGIVGPKLLYPDDTLQAGGMVFSDLSKVPYHIYQGHSGNAPYLNRPRDFQALTGACFAMRAADFLAVRGFDPIFVNGCEDIDLCFKIRHVIQKKVRYNPLSTVYHLEGKTRQLQDKLKLQNRDNFIGRWTKTIVPDDKETFAGDGFVVLDYQKRDPGVESGLSLFYPILQAPAEYERPLTKNDGLDKMKRYWNECASENARKHIAINDWKTENAFHESGQKSLADLLTVSGGDFAASKGLRVLDIGCGIGRMLKPFAERFPNCQFFGVDVSDEMVRKGRLWLAGSSNTRLYANSGADLDMFDDGSLDFIYSYIVFQHIPRKIVDVYFREVARIIAADGLFVFQMQFKPGPLRPPEPSDTDFRKIRYYSMQEVSHMCSLAELEIIRTDPVHPSEGYGWFIARKMRQPAQKTRMNEPGGLAG